MQEACLTGYQAPMIRAPCPRPAPLRLAPSAPREGCAPGVLPAVFQQLAPPKAVYVSCDPESLANELPTILKAGYRITSVQPVDMFPHTKHIETVIVFDAQGSGARA